MGLTKGLPKIRENIRSTRYGDMLNGPGTFLISGSKDTLLLSYGHKRTNGSYAVGLNGFYKVSQKLVHQGGPVMSYVKGGVRQVRYPLGTSPGYTDFPSVTWPKFADEQAALQVHSATGRARTRPGNPVASVGQFVIELRDLPARPFKRLFGRSSSLSQIPKMLFKELTDFQNLGSEYLNVVFGWKPFVNDLKKMYHLYQDIDKHMAKLVRENGKTIRRRATIKKETTTRSLGKGQSGAPGVNQRGHPGLGASSSPQGSAWEFTETASEEVWYVANYQYYIPDTSSSQWDTRARLALFGALPTPDLLYNVLPWTWLIDWFSNVGDIISNISPNAVDNLTTKSSFVMKKTKLQRVWSATSFGSANHPQTDMNAWSPGNCQTVTDYVQEAKLRGGGGNPFGLNVQLGSLSNGQLGILAALGLSRSSVR